MWICFVYKSKKANWILLYLIKLLTFIHDISVYYIAQCNIYTKAILKVLTRVYTLMHLIYKTRVCAQYVHV